MLQTERLKIPTVPTNWSSQDAEAGHVAQGTFVLSSIVIGTFFLRVSFSVGEKPPLNLPPPPPPSQQQQQQQKEL